MKRFFKGCLLTVAGLTVLMVVITIVVNSTPSLRNKYSYDLETPEGREALAEKEAEAKAIPAAEFGKNLRAYKKLAEIDPSNEMYKNKVLHYQAKIHDAEAAALKEAERRRVEMEAAKNASAEKIAQKQAARETAQKATVAAQKREKARKKAAANLSMAKTEAWIMAKQFVEQNLKAPSTAEWGSVWKGTHQSPEDCVSVLGDYKFKCRGWVDSQNSFGAMIRTQFSCTVQNAGGGSWKLLDLTTTP